MDLLDGFISLKYLKGRDQPKQPFPVLSIFTLSWYLNALAGEIR